MLSSLKLGWRAWRVLQSHPLKGIKVNYMHQMKDVLLQRVFSFPNNIMRNHRKRNTAQSESYKCNDDCNICIERSFSIKIWRISQTDWWQYFLNPWIMFCFLPQYWIFYFPTQSEKTCCHISWSNHLPGQLSQSCWLAKYKHGLIMKLDSNNEMIEPPDIGAESSNWIWMRPLLYSS